MNVADEVPCFLFCSGLVFERATIELWLATRGQVCPISNEVLLWSLCCSLDLQYHYIQSFPDAVKGPARPRR
jgi:hypothetical protein